MRIRTLIIGIITATGFVLGIGMAPPANAVPVQRLSDPNELCSVDSNGQAVECLNNWNGAYGAVKSYAPNVANDSFVLEGVDRCGNGDYTTNGCPVSGVPRGLFVYQIAYGNNLSECVATNTNNGNAIAGQCNKSNGYGGSYGTLEIQDPSSGCPGDAAAAVNVYWTGRDGGWNAYSLGTIWWATGNGNQVYLNAAFNGTLCLGYFPFNAARASRAQPGLWHLG